MQPKGYWDKRSDTIQSVLLSQRVGFGAALWHDKSQHKDCLPLLSLTTFSCVSPVSWRVCCIGNNGRPDSVCRMRTDTLQRTASQCDADDAGMQLLWNGNNLEQFRPRYVLHVCTSFDDFLWFPSLFWKCEHQWNHCDKTIKSRLLNWYLREQTATQSISNGLYLHCASILPTSQGVLQHNQTNVGTLTASAAVRRCQPALSVLKSSGSWIKCDCSPRGL